MSSNNQNRRPDLNSTASAEDLWEEVPASPPSPTDNPYFNPALIRGIFPSFGRTDVKTDEFGHSPLSDERVALVSHEYAHDLIGHELGHGITGMHSPVNSPGVGGAIFEHRSHLNALVFEARVALEFGTDKITAEIRARLAEIIATFDRDHDVSITDEVWLEVIVCGLRPSDCATCQQRSQQ